MLLAGKKALVTGAGGKLGGAIAERFASEGCSVILADIHSQKAEDAADLLNKQGFDAKAVAMDVTDEQSVKRVFDGLAELDILVNNAGVTRGHYNLQSTLQEWNDILNVNLTSVFLCAKSAFPLLMQSPPPPLLICLPSTLSG
ncbi:SDR family NAD(P)-dependent oxidoreductase [Paenibacillus sp. CC-CFT747]|nr:SDR family NAD(P)-dependent oxidoreductase [Paenibacillus sp. CC-CFT747]